MAVPNHHSCISPDSVWILLYLSNLFVVPPKLVVVFYWLMYFSVQLKKISKVPHTRLTCSFCHGLSVRHWVLFENSLWLLIGKCAEFKQLQVFHYVKCLFPCKCRWCISVSAQLAQTLNLANDCVETGALTLLATRKCKVRNVQRERLHAHIVTFLFLH